MSRSLTCSMLLFVLVFVSVTHVLLAADYKDGFVYDQN